MNSVGIVLFNPDIDILRKNLVTLIRIADTITLIDNNSNNLKEITELTSMSYKIELLTNMSNLGISTALNQIVLETNRKKAKWVLLLDQDSIVPDDIFCKYNQLTDRLNVAIICPRIVDINLPSKIEEDESIEAVKECITSGSYVNIDVLISLGLFDKEMFIDLVDFEYCLRVARSKQMILRHNGVVLLHRLGSLKVKRFFRFKIHVTNHTPIRVYYKIRNNIYLKRKYPNEFTTSRVIKTIFNTLIKVILFEKNKLKKIKSIFKGWIDGKRV